MQTSPAQEQAACAELRERGRQRVEDVVVERVALGRVGEREAGETFRTWLDRSGGAAAIGQSLKELDVFPNFEDNPDFYIDYGETGPYVAEIGASECAT